MKKQKFLKFLYALAVIIFMAGCTVACTYLFLAAYDLGARSVIADHNVSAASSGTSDSAASSASIASSQPVSSQATSSQATSSQPASSQPASSQAPSSQIDSSQASEVQTAAVPESKRELVLVNLDNKIPNWYAPRLVNELGFQMDSSIVQPFEKMRAAASKDGVSLWISSAYRSNERQNELFQQEVEQYSKTCPTYAQALASAEKSVAKPGYSEHATGLAMDLNGVKDDFDTTPAFRWLSQHAQDYGFVLRYPKDKQSITKIKYEPWHYRYVGVQNAKAIKKAGQCLEEYLKNR